MKLGTFILFLVAAFMLGMATQSIFFTPQPDTHHNVEWSGGNPVVMNANTERIELGFRADGILVWRNKK